MIDTHTHLYLEDFTQDINDVISRAIDSGVSKMLLPSVDSKSTKDLTALCEQYPQHCFPMIGLHPTSVDANFRAELNHVETELKQREYIAIGEIGIDLYWDKTYFKEQADAFLFQLALAEQYHLPAVVHTRNSFDETYDLLCSFSNQSIRGVFHCFSGNTDDALKIIEKGFKIGVGGVVTFKNAILAEVVANIDLKHIVLETDAPYLSPVPHRGTRNESAYIRIIAEKVAAIKNISVEEVAEVTTRNAYSIFDRI